MIPEEVESRIAKYFLWTYLPDEVMNEIEDKLLPPCTWLEQEDLDNDELVSWAIEIIEKQLKKKFLK